LSLFVIVSGAVDSARADDPHVRVTPAAVVSAGPPVGAPAGEQITAASVDGATAAHCARSDKLVGSNCTYTTGLMARRVIEEGEDWSWEGALTDTDNNLSSSVAAPFAAGEGTHVIANELVESLSGAGLLRANLSLTGKLLEVDGVRYVVVTAYKVLSS
jgi:hypothetical protein